APLRPVRRDRRPARPLRGRARPAARGGARELSAGVLARGADRGGAGDRRVVSLGRGLESSMSRPSPVTFRAIEAAAAVLPLPFVGGERVRVVLQFGVRIIDEDQPVMWLMAQDLAHGRFREPCFYGQSYNLPIEALLAAPWMRVNASPVWTLPIVTG